jgi:hypothetical protein
MDATGILTSAQLTLSRHFWVGIWDCVKEEGVRLILNAAALAAASPTCSSGLVCVLLLQDLLLCVLVKCRA